MNEHMANMNVLEASQAPQQPEPRAASPEAARISPTRAVFGWLGQIIPTFLVLAALAGLAYWGHHTGWTVPKFSALAGKERVEKDDWCNAHGVPESQCVECKPDLLPKPKTFGWCRIHGVHECPLEYPEVAQLLATPKITPADLARAERALNFTPRPENNSKCKLQQRRIQFVSKEAVEKAGFEVEEVGEEPIEETVSANGEVTYDQTRVARVTTPVSGRVWRVEKVVGQSVRKGEVLALVDAFEVGKAKAEFLQALAQVDLKAKTLDRLRPLAGTAVAGKDIPEAEAALREAQIRLASAEQALVNLELPIRAEDVKGLSAEELARRVQFLGIPDAIAQALDPKMTTGNLLPLKAPLDGVVVSRDVGAREVVDTTKVLFVVADITRMWLTLNVRQEDTTLLSLGKLVRFHPGGAKEEILGTIIWMSTAVDEKTRTVKVRADLLNPEGRLRANTFGLGQIVLREEKNAVVVPNEAIHWEGDCYVIFVRDKSFFKKGAPKVFHVRTVRPGAKTEKFTEIIAGVLPGENVATKGSGVLRSELLKNNLGEG
jgi:cobalt-zinc-cadmium efflux system membrane fusion protein